MSTEKKNPLKRDHALNDASNGQFGESLDIPTIISRYKRIRTNEQKLPEDYQRISDNYQITTAGPSC